MKTISKVKTFSLNYYFQLFLVNVKLSGTYNNNRDVSIISVTQFIMKTHLSKTNTIWENSPVP